MSTPTTTDENPALEYLSKTQEVETDAGRVVFVSASDAIKLAEYAEKKKRRGRAWERLGIFRMSEGNE